MIKRNGDKRRIGVLPGAQRKPTENHIDSSDQKTLLLRVRNLPFNPTAPYLEKKLLAKDESRKSDRKRIFGANFGNNSSVNENLSLPPILTNLLSNKEKTKNLNGSLDLNYFRQQVTPSARPYLFEDAPLYTPDRSGLTFPVPISVRNLSLNAFTLKKSAQNVQHQVSHTHQIGPQLTTVQKFEFFTNAKQKIDFLLNTKQSTDPLPDAKLIALSETKEEASQSFPKSTESQPNTTRKIDKKNAESIHFTAQKTESLPGTYQKTESLPITNPKIESRPNTNSNNENLPTDTKQKLESLPDINQNIELLNTKQNLESPPKADEKLEPLPSMQQNIEPLWNTKSVIGFPSSTKQKIDSQASVYRNIESQFNMKDQVKSLRTPQSIAMFPPRTKQKLPLHPNAEAKMQFQSIMKQKFQTKARKKTKLSAKRTKSRSGMKQKGDLKTIMKSKMSSRLNAKTKIETLLNSKQTNTFQSNAKQTNMFQSNPKQTMESQSKTRQKFESQINANQKVEYHLSTKQNIESNKGTKHKMGSESNTVNKMESQTTTTQKIEPKSTRQKIELKSTMTPKIVPRSKRTQKNESQSARMQNIESKSIMAQNNGSKSDRSPKIESQSNKTQKGELQSDRTKKIDSQSNKTKKIESHSDRSLKESKSNRTQNIEFKSDRTQTNEPQSDKTQKINSRSKKTQKVEFQSDMKHKIETASSAKQTIEPQIKSVPKKIRSKPKTILEQSKSKAMLLSVERSPSLGISKRSSSIGKSSRSSSIGKSKKLENTNDGGLKAECTKGSKAIKAQDSGRSVRNEKNGSNAMGMKTKTLPIKSSTTSLKDSFSTKSSIQLPGVRKAAIKESNLKSSVDKNCNLSMPKVVDASLGKSKKMKELQIHKDSNGSIKNNKQSKSKNVQVTKSKPLSIQVSLMKPGISKNRKGVDRKEELASPKEPLVLSSVIKKNMQRAKVDLERKLMSSKVIMESKSEIAVSESARKITTPELENFLNDRKRPVTPCDRKPTRSKSKPLTPISPKYIRDLMLNNSRDHWKEFDKAELALHEVWTILGLENCDKNCSSKIMEKCAKCLMCNDFYPTRDKEKRLLSVIENLNKSDLIALKEDGRPIDEDLEFLLEKYGKQRTESRMGKISSPKSPRPKSSAKSKSMKQCKSVHGGLQTNIIQSESESDFEIKKSEPPLEYKYDSLQREIVESDFESDEEGYLFTSDLHYDTSDGAVAPPTTSVKYSTVSEDETNQETEILDTENGKGSENETESLQHKKSEKLVLNNIGDFNSNVSDQSQDVCFSESYFPQADAKRCTEDEGDYYYEPPQVSRDDISSKESNSHPIAIGLNSSKCRDEKGCSSRKVKVPNFENDSEDSLEELANAYIDPFFRELCTMRFKLGSVSSNQDGTTSAEDTTFEPETCCDSNKEDQGDSDIDPSAIDNQKIINLSFFGQSTTSLQIAMEYNDQDYFSEMEDVFDQLSHYRNDKDNYCSKDYETVHSDNSSRSKPEFISETRSRKSRSLDELEQLSLLRTADYCTDYETVYDEDLPTSKPGLIKETKSRKSGSLDYYPSIEKYSKTSLDVLISSDSCTGLSLLGSSGSLEDLCDVEENGKTRVNLDEESSSAFINDRNKEIKSSGPCKNCKHLLSSPKEVGKEGEIWKSLSMTVLIDETESQTSLEMSPINSDDDIAQRMKDASKIKCYISLPEPKDKFSARSGKSKFPMVEQKDLTNKPPCLRRFCKWCSRVLTFQK